MRLKGRRTFPLTFVVIAVGALFRCVEVIPVAQLVVGRKSPRHLEPLQEWGTPTILDPVVTDVVAQRHHDKEVQLNPEMLSVLFGDVDHSKAHEHDLGVPSEAVLREMSSLVPREIEDRDRERIVSILFGDGGGARAGQDSWLGSVSNATSSHEVQRLVGYLKERLGFSAARRECLVCSSPRVVQGVAADREGSWLAFFCKECAPHLTVRSNAQVPVRWPVALSGNHSARLNMLPIYKRCHSCRRFATFGMPPEPGVCKRREIHCKIHKTEAEVDVVHRPRLCQHWEGCTRRPSFNVAGSLTPKFCKLHRLEEHVDVIHHRRCKWRGGGGNAERCHRSPLFGSKGRTEASWCGLHRAKTNVFIGRCKCRHSGCAETACFGNFTDGRVVHCTHHRAPEDVDLVSIPFQQEHSGSVRQRVKKARPRIPIGLHPPLSLDPPTLAL